jgi:hypothetical protein
MKTTSQRLLAMQKWTQENLCKGRSMKTQAEDDCTVAYTEPRCHLFLYPRGLETSEDAPYRSAPSILITPTFSWAKQVDEQRFDKYNNVYRNPTMGGQLNVQFVFSIYEPGTRNENAQESGSPLDIASENQAGFVTLLDWMDELQAHLKAMQVFPGTDMFVWEKSIGYTLRTVQESIADDRPYYLGFVTCSLGHHAHQVPNVEVNALLD